jgi:ribose transport system ATP-binding protein
MQQPFLEARNILKRFLGVQALNQVSAKFFPNEVVAVMGENGAGKSTLMKVLAGVHSPDEGKIYCDGKEVQIANVRAASQLGIAFIHQELNLADNLTVAANVFLGRELVRGGFLDEEAMNQRTRTILDELGMSFSPDTLVSELSIGHQQMVEIAKALSQDAKLLIMDEPTSSLSQSETDKLFHLVKNLRAKGLCIVFISHRMAEVSELADRVIVLRDGRNSGELGRDDITRENIVTLMVGRDLIIPNKLTADTGPVLMEIKDFRISRLPKHSLNFQLRAGEVVGFAGLVGAGRTDLARALFGIDKFPTGKIIVGGREVRIQSPRDAIRAGMAYVPEDRKQHGIILEMAIRDNISMASLERFQRAGIVKDSAITVESDRMRERLNIRTTDVFKAVGLLSGGNQQKVAIAKWLMLEPKIFLLDEPTRGVDVGAKSEIYAVIEQLAENGATVLLISSEMEEILRVSDRVIVMHEGQITGELDRSQMSEQAIMRLATGTHHAA